MSDTHIAKNINPQRPPQQQPQPTEERVVRPLPLSQDYFCPIHTSEGSWGTLWGLTARIQDTLEDMRNPRYWDLLAEKMRPHDMIWARFPGDDRYEHFSVRKVWRVGNAIHPNRAIVQHLPERSVILHPAEMIVDTGDYSIRFDGPKQGWAVYKGSERVAEGIPSQIDAQRRAEQLAAAARQKQNISRQ